VKKYFEKELSWLSFNERVLQEAADPEVPIIERVRFLGIFSSNLDEFFRVRVADVHRLVFASKSNHSAGQKDGLSPADLLQAIEDKVSELNEKFNSTVGTVILQLARRNIFLINEEQLGDRETNWLNNYFRNKVLRHINPIFIGTKSNLSKILDDEQAYLIGALHKDQKITYAVLEIPVQQTSRFIALPRTKGSRRKSVIVLDNAIRACADQIFKPVIDYDRVEFYSIKVTRDAEFDLERDIEHSMLERMSEGLKQRFTNRPVRLVYDKDMPDYISYFLRDKLNLKDTQSIEPSGRYRNFRDFIGFPNYGSKFLENTKLPSLNSKAFDQHLSPFDAISQGDILLHYPYHDFNYLTDMIRIAAFDPNVTTIQMTVYRVASNSIIMKSLTDAVNNGKKVTVIVELRARFDEQANIEWARTLTEAGIEVEFGVSTIKCHSKLILVTRREAEELVRYAHIGTGNFNEKTAKIYTDFSLFTKNPEITNEVAHAFDFIVNPYKRFTFKQLVVSPNYTRSSLAKLINNEILAAKEGKKAEIFIKVNNLVDKQMTDLLYKASQAGVKVRLIVRGMCNLLPGVKGLSDNIQAISIVDRFLEHPRVFVFHAGGEKKMIISSADLMTRNIEYRIEVGTPILDPKLKKQIFDILELQWRDTTKARILDAEQSNNYVRRGNRKKIRSQLEVYDYLKQLEANS